MSNDIVKKPYFDFMKRSRFFQYIATGTVGTFALPKEAFAAFKANGSASEKFYIGSYTDNAEQGISTGNLDPTNGDIKSIDVCKNVQNPSFLIFGHQRKFLYSVNETDNFEGKKSGSVSAFKIDENSGRLNLLNSQPSLGANPCHITTDRSGKFILVANYTGGNVAVLPVSADGKLGAPVDMVQHSGKGPNLSRQETAHAHSSNFSPDNRFVFVCDLGMDKIMVYRFNEKTGKLTPADHRFFATAPGAGPRHLTFTKEGDKAFVVNELNSTLTYLRYDAANGILTELQTISTLPVDFTGDNTCADVHIHPNGLFVYASNRGHDSIAVFSINSSSGKIKLIQNQPIKGKTPRNFAIHSSGRFLIAANQNSNSITVFSINPDSGRLSDTGKSIQVNKPVCILL